MPLTSGNPTCNSWLSIRTQINRIGKAMTSRDKLRGGNAMEGDRTSADEVKALRRRIHDLEAQLQIQQHRTQVLNGGNLLRSEDIDLYPGEQLDFILSLLKQIQPRCEAGSRPYDIIQSILAKNEPIGMSDEILTELQRVFKKGYPTTEADIADLKKIGFTYTPSRKHPKLRFHDKYMFVLPSTPSDKRNEAKNSLSDISKCIAIGFKL